VNAGAVGHKRNVSSRTYLRRFGLEKLRQAS
jgi:hypothetical protein